MKNPISVAILVEKPIDIVWKNWISPDDIKNWNIPFDDWHCPLAENDLREGGLFFLRMESKDGKEGFDYKGKYLKIIPFQYIENLQEDLRKSVVEFETIEENTMIRETFEPEEFNSIEMQKAFCQSVLDKFKNYVESQKL